MKDEKEITSFYQPLLYRQAGSSALPSDHQNMFSLVGSQWLDLTIGSTPKGLFPFFKSAFSGMVCFFTPHCLRAFVSALLLHSLEKTTWDALNNNK